jgi:hypothetical protein
LTFTFPPLSRARKALQVFLLAAPLRPFLGFAALQVLLLIAVRPILLLFSHILIIRK